MTEVGTIPAAQEQPRRKRRSSEEVADRILDAAAEEFETAGYAGATTAAIARRAEVTEAQIFRFYGSKQELFRAAIFKPLNRHLVAFHEANQAPLGDPRTMREMARRYIGELQDFMAQHSRMFMSLIVASAYSPEATNPVSEMEGLRAYFEQGAKVMASRVGDHAAVDPKLMVRVSFVAVLASLMFKDWLFPAGMASDAEIREAIAEFVIDGIMANEEPTASG
ncbi:MAG: TetR/AcrR family transcriptional regulator [Sphingomonadales bacterium]|nr:TetR/AcrR family transcriptional regulator [Sphingomonadales bacterium]